MRRLFWLLILCGCFVGLTIAQDQVVTQQLDIHVEGPIGSSVLLQWTWDETVDTQYIHGYMVYRSTVSGGPYVLVASVETPVTCYLDEGLVSGTYYYVVTTVVQEEEGGYSGQVSAVIH